MGSTTAWKSRRLADRVPRVLARHQTHPAVRTYALTLPARATAFAKAHDDAEKFVVTHKREFTEGRGALGRLVTTINTWKAVLAGAIPGFSEADYADRPLVADDTIADGEQLLELVEETRAPDGQPLPFAADLKADLEPALTAAIKEWGEAEAADVTYQALLRAQRESLALFDEELQRFRRTLMGVLGRSHKDYQKLRAANSRSPDEEDEPAAPTPPDGPSAPSPG